MTLAFRSQFNAKVLCIACRPPCTNAVPSAVIPTCFRRPQSWQLCFGSPSSIGAGGKADKINSDEWHGRIDVLKETRTEDIMVENWTSPVRHADEQIRSIWNQHGSTYG